MPIALLALACTQDNGLSELSFDTVAVATGDFDRVEESLTRLNQAFMPYEGYIFRPIYDDEAAAEENNLKTESLFLGEDEQGDPELQFYDALFVNSGTRGFGEFVYNSTDDVDDSLVTDEVALSHVRDFVERTGRTLVVSDWAYELVEVLWPEMIDFMGEDEALDVAQVGTSDSVTATVLDADLASALGGEQVQLDFAYSYWTVIEGVGADVDVYMQGDIEYRVGDAEGYGDRVDVPLLVGFQAGNGRVLFSAFAWRDQRSTFSDPALVQLVEGLKVGSAANEDVVAQVGE